MTTLYKKDTSDRVRILNIFTEESELIQQTGLIDGQLVEHRKVCTPKNVGRSNETTGEQQAILEMNSKITDELTQGYFRTIEELDSTEVILPMLAKEYKKEQHKIDWSTAFVQRKYDGMRALISRVNGKVIIMSRKGKPIDTMPHIEKDFESLPDGVILDGELIATGFNFQENMQMIKKYRSGQSELVKFHCYDGVSGLQYSERNRVIRYLVEGKEHAVYVESFQVNSPEEIPKYHAQFIAEGFEGTMIRWGTAGYKKNGRSSNLLKYKDWIDIAIPIKDIEPATQRPNWGVPVFHWPGAKDNELRAGWKFDHAFREELLNNKDQYIGKMADIRFFEYSEEGVPRMPVMWGIRYDL